MNTRGPEHETAGSVPPGFAQIPDHLSIVAQHEAPLREWWAGDIAAAVLQRLPVGGGDARSGMQRVAAGLRTQGARSHASELAVRSGEVRIDQALQGPARFRTRCGARLDGGGAEKGQQRLILALHGHGVVPGLAQHAAGVHDALDAAAGITLHTLHLGIVEQRRAMKIGAGSRAVGQVDTIQHHGVKVNVGRERGSEALHEVDRAGVHEAALGSKQALDAASAAVRGEDRREEGRGDGSAELGVGGQVHPQRPRHRKHPLAHRHVRQHPVDQVRGQFSHSAPAARGAMSAALAREGDP
jgi:hypothetical protein